MVTRKRIGLLFKYNEDWVGGLYYVLNIIRSLHTLPDDQKPEIVLFYSDSSPLDDVKRLRYPYIKYKSVLYPLTLFERFINKTTRLIFHVNIFDRCYPKNLVDFVYPYGYEADISSMKKLKKIYWIPDFQHKYMPEFFSERQLRFRDKQFEQITAKNDVLVLSSEAAHSDLKRFYPTFNNKVKVLHFVSVLPPIHDLCVEDVKRKHGIANSYFIVSNQFWPHKNHRVVLKAIEKLSKKDFMFQMVFTGKINKREDAYFSGLERYIKENDLERYVVFAGFIEREEQLLLMKNAVAIIQPSRFEGWSTVVEDAKALNQFIILSDIPVHREQIAANCIFFKPDDDVQLAGAMSHILMDGIQINKTDYDINVQKFASEFMGLL